MRFTQTLLVLLAAALALMLFQLPRAAAAGSSPTYTLPPMEFLGCQDYAKNGDCKNPIYGGRGGTYACTDVGPEQRWVDYRDSEIRALHAQLYPLNHDITALDDKLQALQTLIDQAFVPGRPGSTIDDVELHHLESQYSQAFASRKSDKEKETSIMNALLYLEQNNVSFPLGERDRTVNDFHKRCGCTYLCASDYWQCPGGPPPPTPAPNNPRNGIGGGQCR